MNPCTLMGWENERRALGRCWDDVITPFEGYGGDMWEPWGNIWEGYSMARPNLLLFEADDATHQGYGMEVGQ